MPPIMQGLDLKGMKKHPSLIPLYVVMSMGCSAAVICTIRAALKNPDVSWSRKRNPEPWNEYTDNNYQKFFDPKKSKVSERNRRNSIWDLIIG